MDDPVNNNTSEPWWSRCALDQELPDETRFRVSWGRFLVGSVVPAIAWFVILWWVFPQEESFGDTWYFFALVFPLLLGPATFAVLTLIYLVFRLGIPAWLATAATLLVGSTVYFGGNALVASFGWDPGFFSKRLGGVVVVLASIATWQYVYHVMAQRKQEP